MQPLQSSSVIRSELRKLEATIAVDIHQNLIERCKAGDQSAFNQLYTLYAKAMYNVALRIIKQQQEAEDILQEAFVKAYRKLHQFEYQATFGAWLKRIVINQALDFIRKQKLQYADDVNDMNYQDVADTNEEVDWDEVDFTVDKIKQAMQELPTGFRVVTSLFLFEGYEHKEIAEIMGISESTSKSQYHRAKIKIKEILKSNER
ncbi:RNA polymerase sigma factor [Marivirga atlantica]|jgi:RNA polymerase sigma-70 factor (ECF subfamily)|uniref:RNA polymerase sigma factor n=1 Tax=Marivirga atlantica TaxID=1548457 RepID=A0A937AMS0_9BACT|nr:RNA polymerase sigma factor [Marivirga atlantica]